MKGTDIGDIVQHNITLMKGNKEGQMIYVAVRESIGGNAGTWEGKSCLAANFYYDSRTGKIQYFGNIQDVPKDIVEDYDPGTFRIAVDIKAEMSMEIVEYFSTPNTTDLAKQNLEQTMEKFNKLQ